MDSFDTEDVLHVKWKHNGRWRRFYIPKSGIEYRCFREFLMTIEPDFDGRIDYVGESLLIILLKQLAFS